jgi:predicted RNase H-like nuclease (RuvC/YqgF family)
MLLRISLILAILVGAGTIFVTQKMAREHFTAIRESRDEHIKGEAQQKTRADKSEKEHTATKGKLATTEQTLTKTEEELTGTKQQLTTVQDSLAKTKTQLNTAEERRKQVEAEIAKWESLGLKPEQIRQTIADLKKLQDAIAVLEVEKQILNRQVAELNNKIQLILGPDYEVPLPAGTKGTVVAVDPKWNFVVLDLGKDKAMLEGGVLMVHRNSQLVGKVRIREVMEHRSVANVMPGWKLGEIEEGDQVLY